MIKKLKVNGFILKEGREEEFPGKTIRFDHFSKFVRRFVGSFRETGNVEWAVDHV